MQKIQGDLKQFLLNQEEVEQIRKVQSSENMVGNKDKYAPLYRVPLLIHYLSGMIFAEVMLVIIAIFSQANIDYDHTMKYIAVLIMAIAGLAISYWAISGLIKRFITAYFAVLWVAYALCLMASCFILLFDQNGLYCIIMLFVKIGIVAIAELIIHRTLYRLWISLFVDVPLFCILMQFIKRTDTSKPAVLEPSQINNFGVFCLMSLIVMAFLTFKYCRDWDYPMVVFMLSLYYLLSLGISSVIIVYTSYYFSYPWPLITIINHILFICIFVYLKSIIPPSYKFCSKFRVFKQKSEHLLQQSNRQFLYQVSRGLLCEQKDHAECSRESVVGKPLDQCVCCMSQQSSFCYDQCKHVCVGLNCATTWLAQSVRKCPVCRAQSGFLIRVKRVDSFIFQIVGRYAFRGLEIN